MKRFIACLLLAGGGLRGAFSADSVVVFNEVHYHPATNESASEWVELHNQMAIDIDLSAWSLTGSVGFTFAEGTVIPAGGYLVVASDPAALQAATGLTNLLGPLTGRLNNSSGTHLNIAMAANGRSRPTVPVPPWPNPIPARRATPRNTGRQVCESAARRAGAISRRRPRSSGAR